MSVQHREQLLTELNVKMEYIKERVDKLVVHVERQNGRVGKNENAIQHITDTIKPTILKAIEENDAKRMKRIVTYLSIAIPVITIIVNVIVTSLL